MLAIRLPAEMEQRLGRLAAQTGRTKTYYARAALERYLDDLEDTYLAAERLSTPADRWTLDELERNCDLERGMGRSRAKRTAKARR